MHQRKIPTLVGLLLVGATVMIFRLAFDRIGPLFTRASVTIAPQQVTVTNISDTMFTISWTTPEPTSGSVHVEGLSPTSVYYDDRVSGSENAAQNSSTTFTSHSITVRNLKPETTYTFRILSHGATFLNQGKPYEIRTASAISGLGTGIEPAYGQIFAPSGLPLEGALVYLTLEGGQTLSTLTKSSGTWVIPLNLVRTQNLTGYIASSARINASIIIRASEGEASALTDTLNDNPVPIMTIGKTYDFRKIQAKNGTGSELTNAPPSVLGSTTHTAQQTVAIVKPAQGSAIPSNLPLIQGTGIPGNQVLVVIGIINPISESVIVGTDGIWRYTPAKPLQEGKQSVTITTTDAQSKTVAITNTFEILKSGTQVLGEATPSATLTPEPEPTLESTLAGEPIPETGFPLPLIILLIIGFGLLGGGAATLIR